MPQPLPKLPPPTHHVIPNSTDTKVIDFNSPPTDGHVVLDVIAWHVEVCQNIYGDFYTHVEPVTVDTLSDIFCYRVPDDKGGYLYVFRDESTHDSLQSAIDEASNQWSGRDGRKRPVGRPDV